MLDFFLHPSPVFACCWFILLSLILTLHNKFVFDEVVGSSNILLCCQNSLSIITLLLLRQLKKTNFNINPFRSTRMEIFCSICAAGNVVSGLGALFYVNVVTHGVLKRLTCAASWLIEFFFEKKTTTSAALPSILLLIFGSVVAGYGDLKFSAIGYTLAMISCFSQGAMFHLGKVLIEKGGGNIHRKSEKEEEENQKQQQQKENIEIVVVTSSPNNNSNNNSFLEEQKEKEKHEKANYSSVLYLNALSTLIVAVVIVSMNVISTMRFSQHDHHLLGASLSSLLSSEHFFSNFFETLGNYFSKDVGLFSLIFHLTFNAVLALLMNHAVYLNSVINTPLTHATSGNAKAVLQTIFGTFLFAIPLDVTGWCGVSINLLGGVWYTIVRYKG